MKTQVVLCYFCSELLHFITRRSADFREKGTVRFWLTRQAYEHLLNTHGGMQTRHVGNSRRGKGQRL